MDINAKSALEKKRIKFAKYGIIVGLGAGLAYGFQGVILGQAGGMEPFADASYGIWMICIASLAVNCIHEFFAGIWALIFNTATGRGLKEYGRLLKTKMGWMLAGGAFIGGPLAAGAYMIAINLCGATYAAAITAFFPVIGQILSSIFLKENMSKRAWIGVVVVVVGTLLVGFAPPESGYPHFTLGIIMAIVAAILWALEGLIVTYANDIVDPYVPVGIFRTFGTSLVYIVLLIPLCGAIGGVGLEGFKVIGEAFTAVTPVIWVAIAAVGGAFNYLAFYASMSMAGVGRAMALDVTYAFWSIVFGFILSGLGIISYSITPLAIIGVIIVVIGTILVIVNPKELLNLRGGK